MKFWCSLLFSFGLSSLSAQFLQVPAESSVTKRTVVSKDEFLFSEKISFRDEEYKAYANTIEWVKDFFGKTIDRRSDNFEKIKFQVFFCDKHEKFEADKPKNPHYGFDKDVSLEFNFKPDSIEVTFKCIKPYKERVLIEECNNFMKAYEMFVTQSAADVLSAFIEVTGGKNWRSLNRINTVHSAAGGSIQAITEVKFPAFKSVFLMKIDKSGGGAINRTNIYHAEIEGERGFLTRENRTRILKGDSLLDLISESYFLEYVYYPIHGIKMEYEGISVDSTRTAENIYHKIRREDKNARITYLYFNMASKMLDRVEYSSSHSVYYEKYKSYSGFVVPTRITSVVDGEKSTASLEDFKFYYGDVLIDSTRFWDVKRIAVKPTIEVSAVEKKKLALVIGNSSYFFGGSLRNSINDARAIAFTLKSLGFEVIKVENGSINDLKKSINDFGNKLKNSDVGLFYYAGHGVQSKGVNFIVPVEANLKTEQQVELDCIAADRVLAFMESAGSKVNILIMDACRNNPFERSWKRSVEGNGLAFMNAPSGTIISYATSPGKTADDGAGENGLYTECLLKYMKVPGLTIEQMFKKVRIDVEQKSQSRQTPWESTSLKGDFYFIPNK